MLWHPDQDAEISIIPKRSFYAPRPSRQPPHDDCHHGLVPGCRICAVVCISLESGFFRSTHFFFFFSDSHHVAVCLLGKWGPFAWTCCRLSVSLPMGILVVSRFRLCWTTLPGTSPPQSFSEQRFPFPLGEDLGGKLVWSQRRRVWNVFKNCRTAPRVDAAGCSPTRNLPMDGPHAARLSHEGRPPACGMLSRCGFHLRLGPQ